MAACFVCGLTAVCSAQVDEDVITGGDFLENEIAGRPWALRLRGEVRYTDDDDDLLAEDASYARFPARMYSAETKLFQSDRSTYSFGYSAWRNQQDLETDVWAWKAWVPLYVQEGAQEYHLTLKARSQGGSGTGGEAGSDDTPETTSWYVGVDRSSSGGLYAYLQMRFITGEGESLGQEIYEYVSWKPTSKFRVGEQAGYSVLEGDRDLSPWYASLFATVFLVPARTSLRVDARYYDSDTDLRYQRYTAHLYQRIGTRSLLRLSFRLYDDTGDLSSQAYGAKVIHYFTPRVSAQVGYRLYDHSEGLGLNTFYGGLQLLL